MASKPKELEPGRRPWEKQPWETPVAFSGFAIYRDLGLTRSLTKAAQAFTEGTPGKKADSVRRQFGEWSAPHHWVERAEAYDMHVDERMREQREGRIGRQNRRYETAAATATAALLRRLSIDEWDGVAQPVDFNELDAESVAKTLVNLQRVERIATGQPTELVKGAFLISSADVTKITGELVQGLLQFVPEERQPLAAQWVQSYAQSGGKLAA